MDGGVARRSAASARAGARAGAAPALGTSAASCRGDTEETTTGVHMLFEMAAQHNQGQRHAPAIFAPDC
eukprot:8800736-Lingulodinium_polyedra.AAC.1